MWVHQCHRRGPGNKAERTDPKLEFAFTGGGSGKSAGSRYSENPVVTLSFFFFYQVQFLFIMSKTAPN